MTILALGGELSFHHHLGGDARVIRARLPQRVIARHAVIADEGVDDGFLKTVAHMQAAGHIRRRDHDAVGFFAALGGEVTGIFPALVPLLLNLGGLKCFVHEA